MRQHFRKKKEKQMLLTTTIAFNLCHIQGTTRSLQTEMRR